MIAILLMLMTMMLKSLDMVTKGLQLLSILSSEDEKNSHEVPIVISEEHINTNKTKREIIQSKKRKRFNFSSYLE